MITNQSDFGLWRKKLQINDAFKANLHIEGFDRYAKPKATVFRIKKLYPRIAEVECFQREFSLICYISLIDLWHDRDLLVIQPTRREMIA